MKPLVLFGAALFAIVARVHAADTAYSALRVFGKREGEEALHHVIELRGKGGTPQPSTWKITVEDSRARGGVREVEVRGGKLAGERTPVGRDAGATMNFNALNLDSDGAFTVANQEAEKRGIPFERIDYTLSSGAGGAPLWIVELYEGRSNRVGTVRVAADSGAIVEQSFGPDRRYAEDRAYVENDRPRPVDGDREYRGEERGPGEEIGAFFKRVGRHFQKRGRQLSNFFTGKDGDR
jgi:hypothetical protein